MIRDIIVVGASTGGPEALKMILSDLPRTCAPVLIAQHMPPSQMSLFVRCLERASVLEVTMAEAGMRPKPGQVFVAPGGAHMRLKRDAAGHYLIALDHTGPINRHRPSVDALFRSTALCARQHAIGVLLSGMGNDGAAGMLALRQAGALTLIPDEASCVVYGMPGVAAKLGAALASLPMTQIVPRILEELQLASDGRLGAKLGAGVAVCL